MQVDTPQHLRLWRHAGATVPLNIIAVIGGGLALDRALGWSGQILASLWAFAVFAWLYKIAAAEERRVLVLCTLIAGFGEVVLSLVWGLYDYQFHNVPLFVPPGHALLMTLGLVVARHVRLPVAWLVCAGAALWALYAWTGAFDRFGVVLFGVYLLCMITSGARALYSTMFVLALLMELYGTALGNWRWQEVAPGVGLTQFNPPFSAGAFYCLLDLLVLAALQALPGTASERNVDTAESRNTAAPGQE
jgi:hypothetical protein